MNTDNIKVNMELPKRILLKLALIILVAGALPLQTALADEGSIDCTLAILGLGMPELESQADIPVQADKTNIFKTTLDDYNMGKPLISGPDVGFEFVVRDEEEEDENTEGERMESKQLEAEVARYESSSLEKGDILKAVPSITTKDDKTLGIFVPPFAYFSKKF